ncbi:uncharacterized protein PgNI_03141 [Pyricularia grisea]|uniref:Cx9C motif-containing protein 4, mitochondrial n=1 Tax=Pyricularia grisea TaxID=148305 RepID=A0A6P8BDD1_PYRGI|nr:uncharacterized protein PgNI_03141 [Pyricularia grisea]TLD13881.1 hypothetical protein PgNI_03141 [Pyricularia grisea]
MSLELNSHCKKISTPIHLVILERYCLTKNGYKEEKCQGVIDALYDCCRAFYEKKGDDASTVTCPKPDLLRLKIKQRQDAAGKKS